MSLFGPPNIEKLKANRDINGLIEALIYKKNVSVRKAAAEVLGELKESHAVVPLIAALQDKDQPVRDAAAQALVKMGEPAVDLVANAIRDPNEAMRLQATRILGEIHSLRSIDPLLAALKDIAPTVRINAIEALGRIGNAQAVKSLIEALNDSAIRSSVIDAMGKVEVKNAQTVPLLIAALENNEDPWLRINVIRALSNIVDSRAVDCLVAVLKDQDEDVCSEAAKALKKIGWKPGKDAVGASYWVAIGGWEECIDIGAPAIDPLFTALGRTKYWFKREGAADALDKIGWQPGKDTASVAYWIAKKNWGACISIGTPAVEPLIGLIKKRDEERQKAALTLGKLNDLRAVDPLIEVLKNDSRYLDIANSAQKEAAEALGELKDARAVEPLIAAVEDGREPNIYAAEALGNIGDTRATIPLTYALFHKLPGMRSSAAIALGKLKDARAVKSLIAALKDEHEGVVYDVIHVLVSLYREGVLGEDEKALILTHKDEIARPHSDRFISQECGPDGHSDIAAVEFPL